MKNIKFSLTDLIAGLAPWLAPIPTAWLVGAATMRWLGWPWPVAIVAAVIIESLGLGATSTALQLWDYNRSRRKIDPAAPFWIAACLVGIYFVVAVGLTVALDIFPDQAKYAPAIFPALSLSGMAVLALRSDHWRRLARIEQERAERKAERQAARQLSTVNVKRKDNNFIPRSHDTLRHLSSVKLDSLIDIYSADPGASPTQTARELGVSRQTIYTWLGQLESAGRIRKNGNGVEVL